MPIDVLNKPGKLTDAEYSVIQTHPREGYELLVEGGSLDLKPWVVVLHHHEKFAGSGYPDKLTGERISLLSHMGACYAD
jgi:HD-GYP domain-containing protein (c-di-GMP phosphodiesterase class II)